MCPMGRSKQFSEDLEGGPAGDRGSEGGPSTAPFFVLLFSDVGLTFSSPPPRGSHFSHFLQSLNIPDV